MKTQRFKTLTPPTASSVLSSATFPATLTLTWQIFILRIIMTNNEGSSAMASSGASNGGGSPVDFRVKKGLAQMLKGGVIMDVTDAAQARIAEEAGACAVMACKQQFSQVILLPPSKCVSGNLRCQRREGDSSQTKPCYSIPEQPLQ